MKEKGKLQEAIDKLEKTYGKGTVILLGDKPDATGIDFISTGSLGLDVAIGIGGFPKGRVVEIYGMEASGKTSIAIHAMANCQKAGGTAALLDFEMAFDKDYSAALGVDVDKLLISQPGNAEEGLEVAEGLIRSGEIDLLVIDSVAAMVPKSEIEGDMGGSTMGLHARLMSQALRKLTGAISQNNCCVIFINQMRSKIGLVFGDPMIPTGGNALKFYSSIRLDVRTTGSPLKDKDGNFMGNRVKVKVAKNKLAPPFRIAEFDIEYGKGISKSGEIVDLGSDTGVILKSGSWFSYEGTKIAQGRDAAKLFLEDNPEMAAEIEVKIKEKLATGKIVKVEIDE